jgi:hypothetical protein
MIPFHQFSAIAASRGEGLHPKLRAMLERAAGSRFSEVSIRHDGLIQAGPSPQSEVVSSWANVALFSPELMLTHRVAAALETDMQQLSTTSLKRGRNVWM